MNHLAIPKKNWMNNKQNRIKIKDYYEHLEGLAIIFLALYPLRHIHFGLDLWDTGYNYANYTYAGLEHMDSMWFFSTYLTNIIGHLLTCLPAGNTLLGMNLYTSLFVSVMAVASFVFCTRVLRLQPIMVFLGEFLAESLCWCPTAKLYDYLTYFFMTGTILLLYYGLSAKKGILLTLAGVFLGLNVFVRFSNLPQVILILAVWGYGLIEYLEYRQSVKMGTAQPGESVALLETIKRTLLCMVGYFGIGSIMLVILMVIYPTTAYFSAIIRLFDMTDNAADYQTGTMLMSLIHTYVDFLYWPFRLCFFLLLGCLICGVCRFVEVRTTFKWSIQKIGDVIGGLVAASGVLWLLLVRTADGGGFTSTYYTSYDPIVRPGILFLLILYGVCVIVIFHRNMNRSRKLFAMLILISVVVSSIGSNNGVYPSFNNLFLGAPFCMGLLYDFFRKKDPQMLQNRKINESKTTRVEQIRFLIHNILGSYVSYIPIKVMMVLLCLMILLQTGIFGAVFVFAEATGIKDISGEVIYSTVLADILMPKEKADDLQGLVDYANQEKLSGQEVILYGKIPSISFYLQMPSAFNPWPELDSYALKYLEKELSSLQNKNEKPVVIVDSLYSIYYEDGRMFLEGQGVAASVIDAMESDEKWQCICSFLEEMEYERTFRNGKYAVYQ